MKLTAVLFGFATLAAIPAHAEWTQRVRMDTPEKLHGAVWDGSRFLVVGGFGLVETSTDGVHWDKRTIAENASLIALATNGKGLSVAVDGIGYTWATTDGVAWTRSDTALDRTTAIYWTGSRFELSGPYESIDGLHWVNDGSYNTKADGTVYAHDSTLEFRVAGWLWSRAPGNAWKSCTTATAQPARSIAHGQGKWVVVGDSGTVQVSLDGKTWEMKSLGANLKLRSVAYLRGLWIAVGGIDGYPSDTCKVFTSVDAITWTLGFRQPSKVESVSNSVQNPQIVCDSTRWSVVETGVTFSSKDGTSWTVDTIPGDPPHSPMGLGKVFVASSGIGTLVAKENGILAWKQGDTPWIVSERIARSDLGWVVHKDGIWLAAGTRGDSSVTWRSTDGLSWSEARIPFQTQYQVQIQGLFAARGLFIASAYQSPPMVSQDGITWQAGSGCAFGAIADNGQILVSMNPRAWQVCSSEDGKAWTSRRYVAGTSTYMTDVQWNGKVFVAIGKGSAVWSSPDGISWTAPDSGKWSLGIVKTLAWNGTTWCVRSEGGTLLSQDGVNWTEQDSWGYDVTAEAAWHGSFVVGSNEREPSGLWVNVSNDGLQWNKIPVPSAEGHSITYTGFHDAGDTLYAFTNSPSLAYTSDLQTWAVDRFTSNSIQAMAQGDGLLVAVGENSNIWTRPTNAVDVGIRPRAVRNATQFLLTGRTLRIPGGASLSADLVDLRGRVVAHAEPRGEDLVLDLRGAGSGIAAVRVRDLGHLETRMLVLP